jgi:hypothetical protein
VLVQRDQTMTMLKQISPNDTVRSTARRVPIAGLTYSDDLAGIGEGLLDAPA